MWKSNKNINMPSNGCKYKQKSILDYFNRNHKTSDQISDKQTDDDIQIIDHINCSGKPKKRQKTENVSIKNIKIVSNETEIVNQNKSSQVLIEQQIKVELSCNDSDSHTECQFDYFIDTNQFLEIDFQINELSEPTECSVNNVLSSEDAIDVNTRQSYIYHNFRHMIDCVLSDANYIHLFNANDWKVIESFTCLRDESQLLFIRLFLRKRHWIRNSTINREEFAENIRHMLTELIDNKFLIDTSHFEDLSEALKVLDLSELKVIARSLKALKMTGLSSKKSLIDAIIKYVNTCRSVVINDNLNKNPISDVVLKTVKELLRDSCYKVDDSKCDVFERMFLLNYYPEYTENQYNVVFSHEFFKILKVDTGQEVYPSYSINRKSIIYKTRDDLINYSTAYKLENSILTAIERKQFDLVVNDYANKAEILYTKLKLDSTEKIDSLLPSFLLQFTAGHTYIRCLSHCVNIFERRKNYNESVRILDILLAQNVYCNDYRGRWYERLALDLETHLKQQNRALLIIDEALNDVCVRTGHRLSLYTRRKKLEKSLKEAKYIIDEYKCLKYPETTIFASTLNFSISDRKNIFKINDSNGDVTVMPVEDIVINHYTNMNYSDGIHTESHIYHALFSLLFWDIIYFDDPLIVNDSFRFLYQRLPLDFNSDDFYIRRKTQIIFRLETVKQMDETLLNSTIENAWNLYNNSSSLISWQNLDINKLKEIASCFGSVIISAICERLATDFRHTRSGFPDLIVWNYSNKTIKVIEVKGPNDRPSTKQILWLNFLKSLGVDVEICYVKVVFGRYQLFNFDSILFHSSV